MLYLHLQKENIQSVFTIIVDLSKHVKFRVSKYYPNNRFMGINRQFNIGIS
jgi:hypothetical protein